MHQARRRRGYSALLAALALIVTACGTRLPDNAFVNANSGGTGAAAGNRNAQATAKGATATTAPTRGGPAPARGVATPKPPEDEEARPKNPNEEQYPKG